jgi:predicted small secreted protein
MIWNKVPRPNKAGGNGKLSIVINIVVTLLFALAYYYYYLPAINLHSGDLYSFIGITCVIYLACALLTSGFDVAGTGKDVKAYVNFIKVQAMPVGILLLILIAVGVVGSIISMPMLRAGAYRNLLSVETGDFTTEVAEVNFNQIPMLDDSSAQKLGDRKWASCPIWSANSRSPPNILRSTIRAARFGSPICCTATGSSGSITGARVSPPISWWIWSLRKPASCA